VRFVAYGYRIGEVPLDKLPKIKQEVEFKQLLKPRNEWWREYLGQIDFSLREPVSVSLGCHFIGAKLPHPDPNHEATLKAGACKRFASRPPEPLPGMLRKLKRFTYRFCKRHLKPLAADVDLSFETWIESTNYPLWRKEQLRAERARITNFKDPRYKQVNTFMKMETYPTYKHARCINARSDAFKCLSGPWFKAIEKEVFKLDWFIKKIPVRERPQYIIDRVRRGGSRYVCTDYTAFETHFTKEVMQSCEFVLFKYMTQHITERHQFLYMLSVISGLQKCVTKWFTIFVSATRMSGEMDTSLANGFSNLMLFLFIYEHETKTSYTVVTGVVEGDDGLFSVFEVFSGEVFKKVGMTIKLEVIEQISEASFCGLVFDEEDKKNVTNIIEAMLDFPWTNSSYISSSTKRLKELLRSKSLSMLYQYPGCPVLQSLASYGLKMTKGITLRIDKMRLSLWEREQLIEAVEYYKYNALTTTPVGIRTRFLVEKLYGITIEQQIRIENIFDSATTIAPFQISDLEVHYTPHPQHYYAHYTQFVDVKNKKVRAHPHLELDSTAINKIDVELLKV
jgi:hypothetical protein